jgi:hypothetical protein
VTPLAVGTYAAVVSTWTCPECGRRFARSTQGHECAPALSEEEYFASGPAHERPIFEAVMRHLATVGPVDPEFVSVGIFFKRPQKFAELRPKDRWVAIGFSLRRQVRHPCITRRVIPYGGRYWHVANVRSVDDLDDHLLGYLAEAYEVAAT